MKLQDVMFLFSTLAKCIPKILVLPHSPANVVKVFSRINLNETKLIKFL